MAKQLRDAVKRFNKLWKERKDYIGDDGYVFMTEELAGIANEISDLIGQMENFAYD